jgi:hypothetical protein
VERPSAWAARNLDLELPQGPPCDSVQANVVDRACESRPCLGLRLSQLSASPSLFSCDPGIDPSVPTCQEEARAGVPVSGAAKRETEPALSAAVVRDPPRASSRAERRCHRPSGAVRAGPALVAARVAVSTRPRHWPRPRKGDQWSRVAAGAPSLVDGEMLAQSQVLEGELAVAAEEEGEEPKQVEQGVIIEPGLCADRGR